LKIGLTLLVRDEHDIIKQWLDFHIPKADFIVVTDNGSVDGTRDILEQYSDAIQIIDEPEQNYQQAKWVNRMVKICADKGCEYVANSDADEMWHCDFHSLAGSMKSNTGAIAVKCRLYVPTVKDDQDIIDPIKRMKYYTTTGRNKNEQDCIGAWNKLLHRVEGFKSIELGNHKIHWDGVDYKTKDAPVGDYIAHYPNRCWNQYRFKYINGGEAYFNSTMPKAYGWHWRSRYSIYYKGGTTALKRLWYQELEHKITILEKDD